MPNLPYAKHGWKIDSFAPEPAASMGASSDSQCVAERRLKLQQRVARVDEAGPCADHSAGDVPASEFGSACRQEEPRLVFDA